MNIGVQLHTIKLLKSLYTDNQCIVECTQGTAQPFLVHCGLRQGCHLSTTLFRSRLRTVVWGALTDLHQWVFYRIEPHPDKQATDPNCSPVCITHSGEYSFCSKIATPQCLMAPQRDCSVVVGTLAAAIFPELQKQQDLSAE